MRVDAGIRALRGDQASEQQARAKHQNERQSNLADDEHASRNLTRRIAANAYGRRT